MKTLSHVLFTTLAVQLAVAQPDGTLVSRQQVHFPHYSQIQGIDWYYPQEVYENAINDKLVRYEKLIYKSDGHHVVAFLTSPMEVKTQNLPVIIFNRGSYIRNDIAFVHSPLFQKLVHNGFVVIAPALRESEGGQGKDELGGREINDILNVKLLINHLPGVDKNRIFMLGESRGGMMCFQALKNKFEVAAIATIGAITELNKYMADNPGSEEGVRNIIPDYDTNKEQQIRNRSVIYWVDVINVPLLIMQGESDPQVKPYHSLDLANELSRQGKLYRLIVFEGGNHILSGPNTEERDEQIINWFKKYLK